MKVSMPTITTATQNSTQKKVRKGNAPPHLVIGPNYGYCSKSDGQVHPAPVGACEDGSVPGEHGSSLGMGACAMAKRRPLKRRDDEGLDKPAYARGESTQLQQAEPDTPKRATVQLEEALKGDVAEKLLALKTSLEPKETHAQAPRKPERSSAKKAGTGRAEPDAEEELSFEELLNPRDDSESFETLLEQSKLDWRFFKGDD